MIPVVFTTHEGRTLFTIRVPAPNSMVVSNAVGLGGIVAVVVAIGMLAGFPWALLTVGVIAVVLSALAQNAAGKPPSATQRLLREIPKPAGAASPPPAPPTSLRSVDALPNGGAGR